MIDIIQLSTICGWTFMWDIIKVGWNNGKGFKDCIDWILKRCLNDSSTTSLINYNYNCIYCFIIKGDGVDYYFF